MPIGCNFWQFPQHEAGSDEKFLSALVSAGLALGTAGLSVVAIITIHCMHMLVFASQTLGKLHHSPYLDYGEVLQIFSYFTVKMITMIMKIMKMNKMAMNSWTNKGYSLTIVDSWW